MRRRDISESMLEGNCCVDNECVDDCAIWIEHSDSLFEEESCLRALVLSLSEGVTPQIGMNTMHVMRYLVE